MSSAKERSYEQLKKEILDGEMLPGQQIVELECAHRLNVSRTPLREALRILEKEGLVEYHSNRGVFVRKLDETEIEEMYELREVIETFIFSKVYYKVNKEDYLKLEDNISEAREALKKKNYEKIAKLFEEYHQLMADIAKAPMAKLFLENIRNYMYLVRKKNLVNSEKRVKEAIDEHEELIQLMKTTEIEEFKRACEKHIRSSRNHFFEGMD